jgi:CRP-like cAMP-binding protein
MLGRNRLLALLTPDERAALKPHVALFQAEQGRRLLTPGEPIDSVLLSCGALISMVVAMPDGRTAEAGLVGPEGLVGCLSTTAQHPAFARAVVLIGGPVAAVKLSVIEESKARSPALSDAMARYADCFIAQLLQTIACNALHPLEKRLARWLLTVHDLHGGDEIPLTQGDLSDMLGVQRTSVTATATSLQDRGFIAYQRGRIRIVDPDGLQAASCSCNVPVREHYKRQLRRRD